MKSAKIEKLKLALAAANDDLSRKKRIAAQFLKDVRLATKKRDCILVKIADERMHLMGGNYNVANVRELLDDRYGYGPYYAAIDKLASQYAMGALGRNARTGQISIGILMDWGLDGLRLTAEIDKVAAGIRFFAPSVRPERASGRNIVKFIVVLSNSALERVELWFDRETGKGSVHGFEFHGLDVGQARIVVRDGKKGVQLPAPFARVEEALSFIARTGLKVA